MITENSIKRAGTMLVFLAVCLLAGPVFAKGPGYDKPSIPSGAHLVGPASKGVLTIEVVGTSLKASFEGRCSKVTVTMTDLDVTSLSSPELFAAATETDIENLVETFYATSNTAVNSFTPCYGPGLLGVYVTAVNKSVLKNATRWLGEVTIQGVKF